MFVKGIDLVGEAQHGRDSIRLLSDHWGNILVVFLLSEPFGVGLERRPLENVFDGHLAKPTVIIRKLHLIKVLVIERWEETAASRAAPAHRMVRLNRAVLEQ